MGSLILFWRQEYQCLIVNCSWYIGLTVFESKLVSSSLFKNRFFPTNNLTGLLTFHIYQWKEKLTSDKTKCNKPVIPVILSLHMHYVLYCVIKTSLYCYIVVLCNFLEVFEGLSRHEINIIIRQLKQRHALTCPPICCDLADLLMQLPYR